MITFNFAFQTVPTSRLASLPPAFISDKPFAHQYGLALGLLPPEDDDKREAIKSLAQDALNHDLLLNVEYKYVYYAVVERCNINNNLTIFFLILFIQSKWLSICLTNRSINTFGYLQGSCNRWNSFG